MYIYVCISVYISVYMSKFSNECFSFECWRKPLNKTDQRIYSSVTRIFPACKGVRFLSLYINIMTSEQQKGAAFQTPHDLVTSFWTSNRTKNHNLHRLAFFFAIGILCPFFLWFLNCLCSFFFSWMELLLLFRLLLCDILLNWTLTFCDNPNTVYLDRAWKRFFFAKLTRPFNVFW